MQIQIIGIKGNTDFNDIVEHFVGMGGEAILLDPNMVCGKDHILSSVMHAERAFENQTNRSNNILTETILYAAGERQVNQAISKMRPKEGTDGMVAVLFNILDPKLEEIGMIRCDELMKPSLDKARYIGAEMFEDISCEDAVLEHVAMVDLLKQ